MTSLLAEEVERYAVKVPLRKGEEVRRILASRGVLDRELRIEREDGHLLLPLITGFNVDELEEGLRSQVVKWRFKKVLSRPRNIVEALQDKLPPFKLAFLPSSFDLVGDVAIVELPPELEKEGGLIAQAIMKVHPKVRTVYAKAGPIEGEFRARPLRLLAGINNPVTTHREHGCLFKVDLASTYFSPRLSTERQRVVRQVREGEVVADLFTGVGPYAIQIAKQRGVRVYAIDLNPRAIELLRENVKANKVEGKVEVIHGDAREVVERLLKHVADRVIMHHPSKALDFLDAGSAALKSQGGVIHVYSFAGSAREVEEKVREKLLKDWKNVEVIHKGLVRQISPRKHEVVVDVKVSGRVGF